MTKYSITSSDDFTGASILLSDGTVKPVASSHPRYGELVMYLTSNVTHDEAHILALAEPISGAAAALTTLTSRVTREGNSLFYDGDEIPGALTTHILRLLDEGAEPSDWMAYVRFLERLQNNPSKKSREYLYSWVETHKLSIDKDGMVVGYKGVATDGRSLTSGYGIVDGKVYQKSHLPNEIGSVIEIPRTMVDDNTGVACSVGLHVGSYNYARSFGPRLLTVVFDPADVVSVPSDNAESWKIRVSRYVVKELAPESPYTQATVSFEEEPESSPVAFGSDEEYQEEYNYYLQDLADDPDFYEGKKNLSLEEVKALVDKYGDEDWYDHIPDEDEDTAEEDEKSNPEDSLTPEQKARLVFRDKVEEFKTKVIPSVISGGWNKKLSVYKNKRVTSGQREAFQKALDELGLE